MGLRDSRGVFVGFTDIDLMGSGKFPLIFGQVHSRFSRLCTKNILKVSHGRKYPDLGTYRWLRGLLVVPVQVPVVFGVVGGVHPVKILDFSSGSAHLIRIGVDALKSR